MKLTILGGGGFRVPLVHEAVATAATGLTVDEIALHDVDPSRLATISAVIEGQGEHLTAEGRAVALPRLLATTDLREALTDAGDLDEVWQSLTAMARWEWVRWIKATKNAETRARRVEVAISKLESGKRRPCCFDLSSCTDPELSKNGKLLGIS